jgi:hypothetical protein
MQNPIYKNIIKLIERDSKFSTYKYALLRGVIDVIQDNSPYVRRIGDDIKIPLGLLIEKWILYYYPLLESEFSIPQINGENNLQFEQQLKEIIIYYKNKGGLSAFYNDLRRKNIPNNLRKEFLLLLRKLQKTITEMPMKYIGQSINKEYYSIFKFEKSQSRVNKSSIINTQFLIDNFGYFTIHVEYYEVFSFMGTFLSGKESILIKWAEFSVQASKDKINFSTAIEKLILSPVTERDVEDTKKLYKSVISRQKEINCVWTGHGIRKLNVDHVIPFSIWKNNDLWNLLPAEEKVNNDKRDKIPSNNLIENRKDSIFSYWNLLLDSNSIRFQSELEVTLLGREFNQNWRSDSINKLKETCSYLINERGYEEWNL